MLYFLPTHEYARIEGNTAYIGISQFAAQQLGNVVYVDMPEEGDEVAKAKTSEPSRVSRPHPTFSLLSAVKSSKSMRNLSTIHAWSTKTLSTTGLSKSK